MEKVHIIIRTLLESPITLNYKTRHLILLTLQFSSNNTMTWFHMIALPIWRDERTVLLCRMTHYSSLGEWHVRSAGILPQIETESEWAIGRRWLWKHAWELGGRETPMGPTCYWSNLVSDSTYVVKRPTHHATRAIPLYETGLRCYLNRIESSEIKYLVSSPVVLDGLLSKVQVVIWASSNLY